MKKFTKKQLQSTNYFDLRTFAREIGVKNPTALKKENLINEIIKVQNGEVMPHRTTKGRPAKKTIDTLNDKLKEEQHNKILEIKVLAKRILELTSSL